MKVNELEAQTREPEKEALRGAPGLYEDFLAASAQTAQLENIKEPINQLSQFKITIVN